MKKIFIPLLAAIIVSGSLKAQTFSLNGYGGYVFQDKVSFANAFGYIQEGGFWGASLEGINRYGHAIELLYQQQNTRVPLYSYNFPGVQLNQGNDNMVISYVMLNGAHYFIENAHIQPYGGLGLGVGIVSPESGTSQSKFAWDAKLGVKLKTGSVVGVKLQAQLFSVVQAAGAGFYVGPGGSGISVGSYSSIFQFGFAGGLTFDFDRK